MTFKTQEEFLLKSNIDIATQKKCIPIYSQKLCGILLTKGFVLQGVAANQKLPGKNVFYFNESDSLKSEIENYTLLRN